jgi:hypothetical protein
MRDPEVEVTVKDDATQDLDKRRAWERPVLRRLSADLAETGLLLGPEVILLLRAS